MNKLAPYITVLFFLFSGYHTMAQEWRYDFEEAKIVAQEKDQRIVLFFTGSDWCPPCIKLERNVFSNTAFKEFAEQNFVWVKADFPKRRKNKLSDEQRKKNEELADRYNKRWTFPVILVLDKNGKVLGATGYRRSMTANDYISLLNSFDSFGE